MIRIGAVSFLNTTPLIDGLERNDAVRLLCDVPSRLLEALLCDSVQLALCPSIDFQRASRPLVIVPVGAITSDGSTMTVRLFSRTPLHQVNEVWVDRDSHTSVALLQVVLQKCHGRRPVLRPLEGDHAATDAEAVLLIGDKVVTARPSDERFPFQLDLGEAWKRLTGLPFVFATWMAVRGTQLGDVPAILDQRRRHNSARIEHIARRHAAGRGWPEPLAREYLGRLLRYELGERELEAMQLFWDHCLELGIVTRLRPLELYPG